MKKKRFMIIAAALAAAALMTACAKPVEKNDVPAENTPAVGSAAPTETVAGALLLSVNPEIEIEYDGRGLVVELEGMNDEGKEIVLAYTDYAGKSCSEVVGELVEKIYAAGYFEQQVEGNPRNIVVKIEEGSSYPGDEFLNEVAESVRTVVNEHQGKSGTMVVDRTDLDANGLIGLEAAKKIVLAQLGVSEAQFTEKEYELDDGVYELEFTVNGVEYEYEVHAVSGKVLKADIDNDDWHGKLNDSTRPAGKEPIGLEKAKKLVFDSLGVSESAVKDKDFDSDIDDGKYEIEFWYDGVEYDYEVDAYTGEIIEVKRESEPYAEEGRPAAKSPIGLEKAKKLVFDSLGISESAVKDKDFDSDIDDGKYEIEFWYDGVEYDFEIDAYTGEIIKDRREAEPYADEDDWDD